MSRQQPGPVGQNNNKQQLPVLSDDTVRQLIHQQAQEQVLRGQELTLRKQELDHQSRHASEMLGAQERDRDKQRQHDIGRERNRMVFMGVLVLGLVAFAGWGLYLNKDAVVRDIIQIVLSAVVGALGGYGYAKHSQHAAIQTSKDAD